MQILYSIVTALCLCIGFYFGFKLGRTNELPKIKIKSKKEKEQEATDKKVMDKFERALNNLNRFDGTPEGQEDIV